MTPNTKLKTNQTSTNKPIKIHQKPNQPGNETKNKNKP
jgi:hypothetical protein